MATVIRLVLEKDVENLGSSGDVVKVRPGYARNYLIPRRLAVPATGSNLARVGDLKKNAAVRSERELEEVSALKQRLEAVAVTLERAVGDEDKMYGSVTARDIASAFEERGIPLDKRRIELGEPIRTLGAHEVPVKLHTKVSATLRVTVTKKKT